MDLARRIYSRDLKIAAMREIDGGRPIGEVARQLELSPHLLDRWRGEWRARGELAFPGIGRRAVSPAWTELQRIAELERKIGQLTMENDFLNRKTEVGLAICCQGFETTGGWNQTRRTNPSRVKSKLCCRMSG